MKQYIVDASVAAKWYFREEFEEKANTLFEAFQKGLAMLVVPEIFYPEMAKVCKKRMRDQKIGNKRALQVFDEIMQLPLKTYSDRELAHVAFKNSIEFNITSYDGLYMGLAELLNSPLITADQKLLNACKNRFFLIEPLEDFVL